MNSGHDDRIDPACQRLHGTLYLVPFEIIATPEGEEDNDLLDGKWSNEEEYKFSNYRLLTQKGTEDLFNKNRSQSLREDIKINTLMTPFICRWVEKDGKLVPQLLGGDRRYRAVDFLRNKKEMAKDPSSGKLNSEGYWEYEYKPADEVYKTVICQVYSVKTDVEALGLSRSENTCRVNTGDGSDVAMLIKLRRCNANDDEILNSVLTDKDSKWLRETDNLIRVLDADTLRDLLEDRITYEAALALCEIDDVETRTAVRTQANAESQEVYEKRVKRLQKKVLVALDEKEIAEGTVEDAKFHKDENWQQEATVKVEEAKSKVAVAVKERDSKKPQTDDKQIKKIKARVRGEENAPKALRAPKIKGMLEYLSGVLENEGDLEISEGVTINIDKEPLQLVIRILNSVLAGDDDVAAVLAAYAEETGERSEIVEEEEELEATE